MRRAHHSMRGPGSAPSTAKLARINATCPLSINNTRRFWNPHKHIGPINAVSAPRSVLLAHAPMRHLKIVPRSLPINLSPPSFFISLCIIVLLTLHLQLSNMHHCRANQHLPVYPQNLLLPRRPSSTFTVGLLLPKLHVIIVRS